MARTSGTATASASPTLTQYINLDNYAYTSGLTPPNPKLLRQQHLEPLVQNGQIVERFDTSTGFYGEAFVTTGRSHNLIVAFQGTNPSPPTDAFGVAQAADDLQIYLGQNAASYATALSFTQQAVADAATQGITASHAYVTGHSLGAAEAEYVATQTGLGGATFGTPGIVAAAHSPKSQLANFVEQGDPVGNYASNAPDYLGDIVTSNAIQHYGATALVGRGFHSLILQAATGAYNIGGFLGTGGAAVLLATAADEYHPLGTYAGDLGLRLYSEDFSAGADSGFFNISAATLAAAAVAPVCYVAGTRIRTARGDVAIEQLAVGDLVVTSTGARAPIRWLGHRTIDCARHPAPDLVRPIRIAAHAFGPNKPARDLRVSPAHAIAVDLVGEVLIPAVALLNGTSVTRDAVDSVTYWHLELDAHALVIAENLPAESYLEAGNRAFFADGSVVALRAEPDAAPDAIHASFCRPYVDAGPILAAVRARLAARDEATGTPRSRVAG